MTRFKITAALATSSVLAAALWWRRHPSACPYSQRFWVEAPHPFISRARLLEALEPRPGETVLEVGPGTGYYTLSVAHAIAPGGTLHIADLAGSAGGADARRQNEDARRRRRKPIARGAGARALPRMTKCPVRLTCDPFRRRIYTPT
jgi:predicted methyltransferase